MSRRLKIFLFVLVSVLVVLHAAPYLITVPAATKETVLPFENSKIAVIDGVSLHYRVFTPERRTQNSQNVLLVHGLAGSTFSWRNQVNALRDAGHLVVAVDLPGFGYSDRSEGLNHSQAARAKLLWKLVDGIAVEQGLTETAKWQLVGHSMGGGTVAAMALQHREKTKGIVFVDAAVMTDMRRGAAFAAYPPLGRWLQVIGRYYLITAPRIKSLLESAYGREATAEEVDGYLAPLRLPGTERSFLDMIETTTNTQAGDLRAIADLKIPVLTFWGAKDGWVPLDNALKLKEIIADMTLHVFDEAHHCPMETEADGFNALLLDYLANK